MSDEALSVAAHNIAESGLTNVFLHDAKEKGETIGEGGWVGQGERRIMKMYYQRW